MLLKKKISILGCGWVGKVLFKKLCFYYKVNCLSKDIIKNDKLGLYNIDVLVIAIPPKENYLKTVERTLDKLNLNTKVILLSSISFYKNKFLIIDAEKLVKEKSHNHIVLRLGGLMGYDRIAGKYTSGKILPINSRTNYIHRDDVISIIEELIKKDISNEVFDVVAPIQSNQKEIYDQNAKVFGFEHTIFLNDTPSGKSLSSSKLVEEINYIFKKVDVLKFWK